MSARRPITCWRCIPQTPAIPRLCLALSQPSEVAPGSPTCGPSGEDTTYITASGQIVRGTRGPLGPAFSNDDYEGSIANSNYNSFQASLRHSGKSLDLMLGYTYSKSIDQASSLADILDPFNFNATRGISAFDLKHNLVATYEYQLPLERLSSRVKVLTQGWAISANNSREFRFSSNHFDRPRQLIDGKPPQWCE